MTQSDKYEMVNMMRSCDVDGHHAITYTGRMKPMSPPLFVYRCIKCDKEWLSSNEDHRLMGLIFS